MERRPLTHGPSACPGERKSARLSQAYFDSYAEYNRILRSWFVAFGIGGLARFLVEENLSTALIGSGETRRVVTLFLTGVGVQVLVACLNKYANWYCYSGEADRRFLASHTYRFGSNPASKFWTDILLDLTTVACFLSAIWILYDIFARG